MTPPPSINLSRRLTGILDFIRTSVADHGFPPSIREIGEGVGLSSSSTIHTHLKTLEKRGYLKRNPSKPRSIELLEPRTNTNPVVVYHKRVVDKVKGLHDDLAPVAAAPVTVHEFNTHEEAAIARIKAAAMVEAYGKVLQFLKDASPLGGLQ